MPNTDTKNCPGGLTHLELTPIDLKPGHPWVGACPACGNTFELGYAGHPGRPCRSDRGG